MSGEVRGPQAVPNDLIWALDECAAGALHAPEPPLHARAPLGPLITVAGERCLRGHISTTAISQASAKQYSGRHLCTDA